MGESKQDIIIFRDKLIQKIKLYKWNIAALCLITVVLWAFTLQKEGYHMDELLSFELSNAEYNPWIVPTQPQGRLAKFVHEEIDGENAGQTFLNLCNVIRDVTANRGNSLLATYQADIFEEPVWIERQTFKDYITVDKKDDFNFLSVYFNVKDDNHPPLHFMLLHMVSSIFKGQISPFMGGLINLAAILGICVLLMKIGNLLWQDEKYGIAAALIYGLSSAAVATQLLIRMYGMLAFFCVAALYLHLKKLKSGDFKNNKLLIFVTILGFLTQYFFLFYILVLAAVMAVSLLRRKDYKAFKRYMGSMIISAVIGLICFPFAISDVFKSGRGVEALEKLGGGFSGYGERLLSFGKIVLERSFGGLPGVLLVLCTVFAAGFFYYKESKNKEVKKQKSFWPMLIIPFIGYFLMAARLSPYLVDRYIMAIFPIATLLLVAVYARLQAPAICMGAAAAGFLLLLLITYDGTYLYKGYEEQESVAVAYEAYPCICIYDGSGYYENLIEFTKYEKTLLLTEEELADRSEDEILDAEIPVVMLIKGGLEEETIEDIMLTKYGYDKKTLLLTKSVYGDRLYLFEVAGK